MSKTNISNRVLPKWLTLLADESLLSSRDICGLFEISYNTLSLWVKNKKFPPETTRVRGLNANKQKRMWKVRIVKEQYLSNSCSEQTALDMVPNASFDHRGKASYPYAYLVKTLGINESLQDLIDANRLVVPDFFHCDKKRKVYYWTEKSFRESLRLYRDSKPVELGRVCTVSVNDAQFTNVLKKIHELASSIDVTVTVSFDLGSIKADDQDDLTS